MIALFVALGIAVLTLLALLLWFVPHLLQQQALRNASESAQLRELILDLLNEQEAVMMRQSQLGTSISYLQDQLEQAIASVGRGEGIGGAATKVDPTVLQQLEGRITTMQEQIQHWLETRTGTSRARVERDNESWAYLLSLLSGIQQRIGELSAERANASVTVHASTLLEELEQEMQNLRGISEDIAKLQWRLRRSLQDRESNVAVLRARPGTSPN